IGMERSLEKMQQADVVVYLFDVAGMTAAELRAVDADLSARKLKYVLVCNKVDAFGEEAARSTFSSIPGIIFISAKASLHTEVIKEKLVDLVLQGQVQQGDTIITNARHYHALQEVLKSLQDIRNGLDGQIPGDLVALDIRRCLHYLGEITGEITTE